MAAFDIARHVDPKTESPPWNAELVDRFLRAYYAGNCSMRVAAQQTGVPYRQALSYRAENADFAERLSVADTAHLDVLYEEHQRRALDDPHRPASLIFELKSRHKQYTPASGNNAVKVNIAFVDKAFGATASIEALPERKALAEPVIDVEPNA